MSVDVQDAESARAGAPSLDHGDLAAHRFELRPVVAEDAASRANHDGEFQRNGGPRHFYQSGAGCDSPFEEAAAKFHAIGSAALRGSSGGDRIGADLDYYMGLVVRHQLSAITSNCN